MARKLKEAFGDETWFSEVTSDIDHKYMSMEQRLVQTFRYVQLHTDNGDTFSYEFNHILRDSGNAITSALDKMIRRSRHPNKVDLNFDDFRNFLSSNIPYLYRRSVTPLPASHLLMLPFRALHKSGAVPGWWNSYDRIKHSETHNHKEGNMRNAVNAVAALAIIRDDMGVVASGFLFDNVGVEHPPDAIELDRLLFPEF
jgi:hypothetical protein